MRNTISNFMPAQLKHLALQGMGNKTFLIGGWGDENKTISDGGITVDFCIIKVHTSN